MATFLLDPAVTFLNHGSFGACPAEVLDAQDLWRRALERQPIRFMLDELPDRLDGARARLAAFVGADADGLVFVRNATEAVNAALRSFPFRPGDEILVTDHGYAACNKAARFVAERTGAKLVVASLPFPGATAEAVFDALLGATTERTRFALIDHVTSPTALVMPVERLVPALQTRGVTVMVDGAHAPGMLELDLSRLGADLYTANCHKWMGAPKGAAFVHATGRARDWLHPLVISHGWRLQGPERSRLHLEFDWPGTFDPTAWLCIPDAIDVMGAAHPGGWAGLRAHNHALAIEGRRLLVDALGIEAPCPESMLGAMATVPLPRTGHPFPDSPLLRDTLQGALEDGHGIEVPVFPWRTAPDRALRISAQVYNGRAQYERLAEALGEVLAS